MADVSRVSLTDYAALSAFLAAFPGDEAGSADAWLRRLQAWWDRNPAFRDDHARGWLLRENDEIVGFLGSIPWRFQLGGQETTVFAGTTWRVLPEHRGMSFALKRRQMDEQGEVLHVSTTPREEVQRLLARLGYAPMRDGDGEEPHSAIFLNFRKLLRLKLNGRPAAAALAARAAPVFAALQAMRLRRLRQAEHGKVGELDRAGDAFDDLWRRTRHRYPTTHVRSAAAINWYCFATPEPAKKLFGYFDGDRLAGYAVFLPVERRGIRFFECVDLWTERGARREAVIAALIEKARRHAEAECFDRVYLPHFRDGIAEAYRRLGIVQENGPRRPGYYMGPPELMRQMTPGNSYLVLGEGDYGL